MNNINDIFTNQRNAARDFEDIAQEALDINSATAQEYAKGSESAYLAQKQRHSKRYTPGRFHNDLRMQHIHSLAADLSTLAGKYITRLDAGKGRVKSEYEETYDKFMTAAVNASNSLNEFFRDDPNYQPARQSGIRGHRADETDSEKLKTALGDLEKCLSALDDVMIYRESDDAVGTPDDPAPRALQAELYDICSHLETMNSGLLSQPKTMDADENGKKIHRVVQGNEQPKQIFGGYIKAEMEKGQTTAHFYDRGDEALFPHLPSQDDPAQGNVGNCYMLSALSAIAMQNPDLILDAMRENAPEDDPAGLMRNTVTVRFYNDKNEPVYVTVDKQIPYTDHVKPGGTNHIIEDSYARGALWVQILEKAYALSGLHKGGLAKSEAGRQAAYTDIEDGQQKAFIRHLLGSGAAAIKASNSEYESPRGGYYNTHPMDDTAFSNRLTDDAERFDKPYTKKELAFAEAIEKACASQKIVTCSTREEGVLVDDKDKVILSKGPDGSVATATIEDAGIFSGHAYSLTGIEKKADDRYFVTVRNPHKRGGVIERNGKLQVSPRASGYVTLELHEFEKCFTGVVISDFDLSMSQKDRLPEGNEYKRRYMQTVNKISESLRETDSFFLRHFKNTPQFNAFRDAADKASAALSSNAPDPDAIRESMNALFDAAKTYNQVGAAKNLDAMSNFRPLQRFRLSNIVDELQKEFAANNAVKETSFAELSGKAALSFPVTGYEKVKACLGRDNIFIGNLENDDLAASRATTFHAIKKFIENDGHTVFDLNKIGAMTEAEKAEFFRKPENGTRFACLAMIARRPEDIIDCMEAKHFDGCTESFKTELMFKAKQFAPIVKGLSFALDPAAYRFDNVKTPAQIETLSALPNEIEKAQEQLRKIAEAKENDLSRHPAADYINEYERTQREKAPENPQLGAVNPM